MGHRPAITLNEIEAYFQENEIPPGPIRLDHCTRIHDPEKFVEAAILTLRAHPGNRCYQPYYEQLVQFYKYCKK
jgi:hypothetical protein